MRQLILTLFFFFFFTVKRGRGRPRRRPQSSISGGPIPAFIIPSSGGQAVMMAPVKVGNHAAVMYFSIYNDCHFVVNLSQVVKSFLIVDGIR